MWCHNKIFQQIISGQIKCKPDQLKVDGLFVSCITCIQVDTSCVNRHYSYLNIQIYSLELQV
jgi:hypothetical protein